MSDYHRPKLVPMVFISAFIIGGLLAVVWMYAEVRRIQRQKIPRSEMAVTNTPAISTNTPNAPR